MYSGHWLGGGVFWIFCLLMIIAVIWIIKTLIGGLGTPENKQKSASTLLKERAAPGEIDKEAFDAGKKDSVP